MPSEYIKKIRTTNGDKQIDYESLANLPKINSTELKGNVNVVKINQGSSNSGKFLGIGADGNVSPMEPPQGMTEEQEEQLEQNTIDISKKLNTNQGTENAGKVLGIGSDGMVTPVEGADTQKQLENAIANYYALRRTGKIYQTKLWKFATNPTSTGVKQLDNEGDRKSVV